MAPGAWPHGAARQRRSARPRSRRGRSKPMEIARPFGHPPSRARPRKSALARRAVGSGLLSRGRGLASDLWRLPTLADHRSGASPWKRPAPGRIIEGGSLAGKLSASASSSASSGLRGSNDRPSDCGGGSVPGVVVIIARAIAASWRHAPPRWLNAYPVGHAGAPEFSSSDRRMRRPDCATSCRRQVNALALRVSGSLRRTKCAPLWRGYS